MKFKPLNWNKKDEVCPTCNQVTKEQRGLIKQNFKKLLQKPTMQDWLILLMIAMILFGAWAYKYDVQNYREVIANPQELCQIYYDSILHGNFEQFNESNIPINYDNIKNINP